MGIQQASSGRPTASLPTSASALSSNPGGACSASMSLTNAGIFEKTTTPGGTATIATWQPKGSAFCGLFECRWTVLTGSLSSGTTGSWLNLGTTRTWTRSAGAGADQVTTGTLEIRNAATTRVVATCAVSIEADGS